MIPTDQVTISDSLILIAEDNAITIQLLQSFLKKEGLKSITCSNGIAALSLAKEKNPDLILMDVMMPKMDGYETCKRIKQDETLQHIPVVFLTAKVEETDKVRGFEVGGVDYITKPFAKTEVMVRIKTQLKLKKAADKLINYTERLEALVNKDDVQDELGMVS